MLTDRSALRARVENAANALGRCWPLQSYIAANPLAGFEDRPFNEAVRHARALFDGRGYPGVDQLRHAWTTGAIAPDHLSERLQAHGYEHAPEALLDQLEAAEHQSDGSPQHHDDPLNRIMAKWLAAFLDQGQAVWSMPHREEGFYAAWRTVAPYDTQIPNRDLLRTLPERPVDALAEALDGHPESEWEAILQHHLTALPGWAAFIKWRAQARHDAWQTAHPITLIGYLAARLHTARALGSSIAPGDDEAHSANGRSPNSDDYSERAAPWLEAWEATYREQLLSDLEDAASTTAQAPASPRPDAQLVFCIDVRSEVIRRHLEQTGPYETFGYAGFFGLPMQYEAHGSDARFELCPPIVDPKHRIHETPTADSDDAATHDRWQAWAQAGHTLIKSLKHNIAAAFGFVEASGGLFGAALAARTLVPDWLRTGREAWTSRIPQTDAFCDLTLDRMPEADEPNGLPVGLAVQEKAAYAEAAFRLMGWDRFAPVVVFTGHGSETVNNPYKSSLDCGACAGRPGGPNARALAAICNDAEVRATLRERGIDIPDDTVFLAAQHNTTTDAVKLFAAPACTDTQKKRVAQLQRDLDTAQDRATAERAPTLRGADSEKSTASTERRAADWAETRPEWGLSGNAAFIIGPRALTSQCNLEGRAFLHAYDWQADANGKALAQIMTGPLVVGEWINTQYYFSTVDNAVYGSGSKITQNVVGNFGVWQGNGGDLMTGLPLQSLQSDDTTPYHHPLRLMAVVQAPIDRVKRILDRNAQLRMLFDHEWMALAVMDPEQNNAVCHYQPGGTWQNASEDSASATEDAAQGSEPERAVSV